MDWLSLFVGMPLLAVSVIGYVRPDRDIGGLAGWEKRLNELRNGASETYFEERGQLEAYPPSKWAMPYRRRITNIIGMICGLIIIALAVF